MEPTAGATLVTDEQLISRYIKPNPHRPGVANAWVSEHAVPVWALVAYWEGVGQDIDRVADDYDLPRDAIEAALAYYQRHRHAIDARIADNAA